MTKRENALRLAAGTICRELADPSKFITTLRAAGMSRPADAVEARLKQVTKAEIRGEAKCDPAVWAAPKAWR